MKPFVLLAVRAVPRLGIRVGDRVVWDLAESLFPTVCREIPNTGAVLLAYEEGALEAVTPCPQPAELSAAVGFASSPHVKPSRGGRPSRSLRLLK